MPHRSAISRIQLLIVLLIVALVLGLFLNWIIKIRDSAETLTCRNKLKQFGLAVNNYELTFDTLPPLVDQGTGAQTGRGLPSVFTMLTPYIEATPPFFRPDWPPSNYHAHSSAQFVEPDKFGGTPGTRHGGTANSVWPAFLDPGDRTAEKLRDLPMTLPDGSTGYYGTGSYAANGMLPWGTGALVQSSQNGTANIILLGERPQVCQTSTGDTIYNLWGLGFYSPHMPAFATLTPNDPPGMLSTNQIAPVMPLSDESSRYRVRVGRMDAEPELPGFTNPIQLIRPGQPCDPRLPGTPHRGGMQVVMADGSVRVFSLTTSPRIYWAACAPTEY